MAQEEVAVRITEPFSPTIYPDAFISRDSSSEVVLMLEIVTLARLS